MTALRHKLLTTAIALAFPCASAAQGSLTIYSSAQPGTLGPEHFRNGGEGVVVPGHAMVREERTFTLRRGSNALRLEDVPALIDPTTVSFASLTDAAGTRVVEQGFEFDLTSTAKLLSRYLDREIVVEQARGAGAVEAVAGTLVGTRGGLTLRQPDGTVRVVEQRLGLRLPSLPGGLVSKPALAWTVEAATPGAHKARVAYQTGGITWWADYNLVASEAEGGACRLDAGAWVTIVNQSGASFRDVRLKLVAGDVQRAQPKQHHRMAPQALAMDAAAPAEGFAAKAFFEYHLYTLGRSITIPDNSTRQVELFPAARGVGCERTLVYAGQAPVHPYAGGPYTDRAFGLGSNRKVDVLLRFRNTAANGMGMALPAGKMRVARADPADGSLEFIGEDLVDHTPAGEMVKLRLGSAFDVVGERRQVDFRIDTQARWIEEDIEVKVRNQKPAEAVQVLVREHLYRWSNWTMPRKTHDYAREDARTVQFPVRIAPRGEAVVRYTVRYTW